MQDEKYFSHSWALITRDKGWIKPLLVMTAASFVPVAGALGNKGYAMEYARLTAWGVDAAPKQKNVNVSKCIASGWRGFVVDLGIWVLLGLVLGVISAFVAFIPGAFGRFIGFILSMISWMVCVVVNTALLIAEIRAAIYEKISAGYRLGSIYEMIRRDFGGFLRVFLIGLACSFVVVLLSFGFILSASPLFLPIVMKAQLYSHYGVAAIMSSLSTVLLPLFLLGSIFGLVCSFVVISGRLLTMNAAGLWMRQFDVPNWGRSEDPLPERQPTAGSQQWQNLSGMYQQPGQRDETTDQSNGYGRQPWQPGQTADAQPAQPTYVAPEVPVEQPQDTQFEPTSIEVSELHNVDERMQGHMAEPEHMAACEPVDEPQPVWAHEESATVVSEPESESEPLQVETSTLEEAPGDAFWSNAEGEVSSTLQTEGYSFSADDTASLTRIDVTDEEEEPSDEG